MSYETTETAKNNIIVKGKKSVPRNIKGIRVYSDLQPRDYDKFVQSMLLLLADDRISNESALVRLGFDPAEEREKILVEKAKDLEDGFREPPIQTAPGAAAGGGGNAPDNNNPSVAEEANTGGNGKYGKNGHNHQTVNRLGVSLQI